MATLGIDFGVSSMKVGDHNVKVNIFDMAGQSFFYEVHVTNIFWCILNNGLLLVGTE